MKRLLLFVFSWCLSLTLWANGTEVDGIYYIFSTSGSTNTATVTYTGAGTSTINDYNGAIVIPDTVYYDGVPYTVTAIGEYAFHGRSSSGNYSHVSSVSIPSTVTSIGNYAFQYNDTMEEIVLPPSIQSIPQYCFRSCTALKKVTYEGAPVDGECLHIPATVNAINGYAFNSTALEGSLTLPGTLNYIDQFAFSSCTGLTSVTVAAAVVDDPTDATDHPLYVEINVSAGSTSSYPFNKCSNVKTVYLNRSTVNVTNPNNSTSHEYGLFRNMAADSLTTIYIGKECREIGPNTFYGNKAVTKVIFVEESQLELIDARAFYQCVGYGSGNKTDVVDGSTFYVPNGVKEIGQYAFYQDYGLEGVVFGEDSQLETIGGYAFNSLYYITEFTVPSKVTSIGTNVWQNCKSLKKIHLLNPEPVSIAYTDFSSDGDMDWPLVIYVPYGSEEAYEESSWGTNVVHYSSYEGKIIFNSSVVTIDSQDYEGTYYATYYHPYALDIPDGVAAYAVTAYDSDSGELTLSAVDGVIPQHSGVLLSRTADDDISSYRIYIAEDDAHAAIENNMLYGSETSATTNVDGVSEGYYFYGLTTKDSENLGFYWGAENGAAFTMPANKAWLALPATGGGAPRYLSLVAAGADTTGISAVDASSSAEDAIYTLQGVRVSALSHKGIYIVNGKKVLVK